MADITMKRGDNRPFLVRNLKQTIDGVESAIDLTAASSVAFNMKRADGTGNLLGGTTTITNAVAGEVTYAWDNTDDTNVAGEYRGEYQINWTGGGTETVPNEGFLTILIVEDLD